MNDSREAQNKRSVQVPADHYFDKNYVNLDRMASYRFLLFHILAQGHREVAEIGVGAGVLAALLRLAGVRVTTIDYAADLNPDIVFDIRHLDELKQRFDCIICAQVLEHLPYEEFGDLVSSLVAVSRFEVVITIPDRRYYVELAYKIPGLRPRSLRVDLLWPLGRWFMRPGSQHLWELNRKPFTERRIIDDIDAATRRFGWRLSSHQRIPENPIHHFFSITPTVVGEPEYPSK